MAAPREISPANAFGEMRVERVVKDVLQLGTGRFLNKRAPLLDDLGIVVVRVRARDVHCIRCLICNALPKRLLWRAPRSESDLRVALSA